MIRYKVVGRRDEPKEIQLPSSVPGMPPQVQRTTVPELLVVPVDSSGNEIPTAPGTGMGMGNASFIALRAETFEELSAYVTGEIYSFTSI